MANNTPLAIPAIAQAFQNDPRTRLAQAAMQQGASGAPVAGGGWGVLDGLARALTGVSGAYQNNRQEKRYGEQQDGYMQAVREAQAQALAPQQAAAPAPQPAANMAPPGAQPVPGGGGMSAPSMAQWTGVPQPQGGMVNTPRQPGTPGRFSSAQLASAASEFIPGVTVTSGVRTTARNAAVGGKPNSQHVRGTAIDILPPKGMTPAQVRAQFAARGAQVDVIDEGDHFHVQGVRHPAKVAQSASAAASVAPTGQQEAEATPQASTPAPELPAMPEAPQDVGAVQSERLGLGRRLLNSNNPFAFAQGQEYIDKGLSEQNEANERASDRKFRSQEARYGAALGDYYGARAEQRSDAYATRRQERQFSFEDQQAEKAFGRQLTMEEKRFAHDMTRAGYDRETAYGLASINNDADLQRTMLQITASQATAAEKAAQKRTAFLSTPGGSKLFDKITTTINNNDGVINDVRAFLDLNEKTRTGGTILGSTWLSNTARSIGGNKGLQEMESITAKLAPMLRQAGSGAMSDKDLAGFRSSLPSINNVGAANKSIGTRIIRSMERVNDFEQSRLNAMSEGRQTDFLREWDAFKTSVPVASGKRFEDWKAGLRTVQ